MKTLTLGKRCAKEILRDPINLSFGLGFPLVLLMLLSLAINYFNGGRYFNPFI